MWRAAGSLSTFGLWFGALLLVIALLATIVASDLQKQGLASELAVLEGGGWTSAHRHGGRQV